MCGRIEGQKWPQLTSSHLQQGRYWRGCEGCFCTHRNFTGGATNASSEQLSICKSSNFIKNIFLWTWEDCAWVEKCLSSALCTSPGRTLTAPLLKSGTQTKYEKRKSRLTQVLGITKNSKKFIKSSLHFIYHEFFKVSWRSYKKCGSFFHKYPILKADFFSYSYFAQSSSSLLLTKEGYIFILIHKLSFKVVNCCKFEVYFYENH